MYLDINAYLQDLRSRVSGSPDIADTYTAMALYEDLRLYRHPSGRVVFCSYQNGVYADRLEFGISGRQYWVSRYLEDQGLRLYDDPPVVVIGVSNPGGFGILPEPGLEDTLKTVGWAQDQILKVRKYLLNRAPVDW